ncbi:MAG TPA: DUF6049 family protein [Trebonia sp.]|jgi:hypothetical protein|nr:DUF6049 family protein [Trebonia sp.]
MQTVRSLRRTLGALSVVLLAAFASLAAVVPAAQAASGKTQPPPLAISITGITPTPYATPDATVKVAGTLANHSGSALPGIEVLARTSFSSFQFPLQMTDFTNAAGTGASVLPLLQAGEAYQVPDTVPNGATVRWSVSFQAGSFYSQFGVFPIEVQAMAGGTTYTAAARTLLTFWPGSASANQPKGLQVAWVWPLVDTPQQGACPQTLATSELASSVASSGRLSTLLDAGASWSQTDALTWNIDPALLSDASVMTKPYFTHGGADCSGRSRVNPSTAASKWLSQLKTSTAGASAFLTPYANVDAASLSHSGAEDILKAAYRLGDSVASQILPQTFGKTGTGTGDGQVLRAAWPADGQADAEVLTSLANDGGIDTVVLSSDKLPSSAPGEDALARTVSGVGTNMSVLLANSRITSLLGTASTAKSPSGQFTVTQDFIAQTAMIAAETGTERSLVVAPPQNWDPSPATANALLKITSQAPWLHSTGLSTLAAAAAKLPATTHIPAQKVSSAEFNDAYMDNLASVATSVDRFKSILFKPSAGRLNSLDAALAATASSAWRGAGSPSGKWAISQLHLYLQDAENKVRLVASKKILLAGQSGETAVSVQNGLGEAVLVRVTASTPLDSDVRVGPFNSLLKVQADGSNTVRMPVHSSTLGTTTIQLQLATPTGAPLSGNHATQSLSVEVTRFGRFLLIIIGGALGILVLTSAYRLRRKRLAGPKNDDTKETAEVGGTG